MSKGLASIGLCVVACYLLHLDHPFIALGVLWVGYEALWDND